MVDNLESEQFKLKIRPITCNNSNVTNGGVTEDKITQILEKCYTKTAFSTFPYFCNTSSSEEAITSTNSGNCIALSIYVKKALKNEFGIESCLIPATIPNKYNKPGYLPISHVALLIPIDNSYYDSGVFIVDPAFYFLNPIEIRDFNKGIVFSKNIYTPETEQHLKDYISIDKLEFKLNVYKEDKHFHKYQIIPAGTYYVNCYEINNPDDSWNYFLTEIINPDEAITYGFFLDHQDGPFITSTELENGVPQIGGYLKISGDKISYSKNFKNVKTYNINNITDDILDKINRDIGHFFKGDVKQYLKKYYSVQL